MPCLDPITRSPGHLFFKYNHGAVGHSISWRFITGVDLTNLTILRAEAVRLAALMAGALCNSFTIYGWGVRDATGTLVYEENFGPYVGSHARDTYDRDFESKTMSFTGKGTVNVPGQCSGPIRTVMFVGQTYDFLPGSSYFDTNTDTDLAAFLAAINNSTYLPADFYGQQGDLSARAPIQFNAHAQRKHGS